MLVLTFEVAGMAYAVAAGRVAEVVPRVEVRTLPHAPDHLVGLLRYRGGAVPVIDLGMLLGLTPCRERLDTRIIIVRRGGEAGLLGLVAERVEGVVQVDEQGQAAGAMRLPEAPYLAESYRLDDGLLQMIDPDRIAANAAFEGRAVTP